MGWGDELMAAGDARKARDRYMQRVEIVDALGRRRWHVLWEGNAAIARPGEPGQFVRVVNGPGKRPYHTGKSDVRWTYNLDYRATPAELFFTDAERAAGSRAAGQVILEPHIKDRASPNKQWGWVRWNKLAWLLQRRGYRVAQLVYGTAPPLEGVNPVTTTSFREACAVLAGARAAVLPEGGLHHAAAAVGLPAVVIFGGFTPVEITGYAGHINLGAAGAEACGRRVPCEHCAQWMDSIKPEAVADQLEKTLANRDQGLARTVAA